MTIAIIIAIVAAFALGAYLLWGRASDHDKLSDAIADGGKKTSDGNAFGSGLATLSGTLGDYLGDIRERATGVK